MTLTFDRDLLVLLDGGFSTRHPCIEDVDSPLSKWRECESTSLTLVHVPDPENFVIGTIRGGNFYHVEIATSNFWNQVSNFGECTWRCKMSYFSNQWRYLDNLTMHLYGFDYVLCAIQWWYDLDSSQGHDHSTRITEMYHWNLKKNHIFRWNNWTPGGARSVLNTNNNHL